MTRRRIGEDVQLRRSLQRIDKIIKEIDALECGDHSGQLGNTGAIPSVTVG